MTVGVYQLALFAHLIFFCYWLGADLGVFYSAKFATDPKLTKDERRYVAKVMGFVDQFPRVSMLGTVATGATLAIMGGNIKADPSWLWLVWAIAIFWAGVVLYLYVNEADAAKIKPVKTADFYARIVLLILILYAAITSFMGIGITDDRWLAAKFLALAGTSASGVTMRLVMRNFGPIYHALLSGQATPEQARWGQKKMWTAKATVVCIWIFVASAAAIGLWKPF